MDKLVSIIIPVRNGENFLSEALENIRKQESDVEVIVVDDASDDSTVQIAESYGCKVLKHETCKGQVAGKNSGLKVATGEFVMFHDHDDLLRKGALRTLVEAFDDNTSAVEAMVKDFYTSGMSEAEKKSVAIKDDAYYGLFTGAILIRRSCFDIIGGFEEKTNAGEIIDWEFKMRQNGLNIKKIDYISTDRRIHSSNYGRMEPCKEYKGYAAVLRGMILARKVFTGFQLPKL